MLVSYKLNVRVFPFCEVFLLIDNISVHKMPLKTDLTLKETHLKTYPTMKAINIEREFLMIFFYHFFKYKILSD